MFPHKKLARIVRENTTITILNLPGAQVYFPGGIKAENISNINVLLMDRNSPTYVKIFLPQFTGCFIRANELVIF